MASAPQRKGLSINLVWHKRGIGVASRGIGVVLMGHWRGSGADGLKWTEPGRFKMHLNLKQGHAYLFYQTNYKQGFE